MEELFQLLKAADPEEPNHGLAHESHRGLLLLILNWHSHFSIPYVYLRSVFSSTNLFDMCSFYVSIVCVYIYIYIRIFDILMINGHRGQSSHEKFGSATFFSERKVRTSWATSCGMKWWSFWTVASWNAAMADGHVDVFSTQLCWGLFH